MDTKLKNSLFKFLNNFSWTPYVMSLVGLIIYILFLFFPPPVTITKPFSEFHLGMTILIVVFFGLVFNRKGLVWDTLSLTLVLLLFAISLIYKWQTSFYGGQLVSGYFPLSDAQAYYADAQLLMTGSHVGIMSTRRPFSAGFLSVILFITGNNLQISLGIIVALTAISIYLTTREIQNISNSFSAAVYLMICYWYYFPFAGTLMSESLGLALGSLALSFLLKATRGELNLKYCIYGLFSLTVALNARPGPMIILPTLLIWMGLLLYKIRKVKYTLILILVVALGMMANTVLSKMIGTPGSTPFSKYSEFAYGLVTGGKGWAAAATDHPSVNEEGIFRISLEIFKKQPILLFKAIANSYKDYVAPVNGAFSFMRLVYDQKNIGDRVLWALFVIGLMSAIINHRQIKYGLMLAGFSGIFFSIAFLAPSQSDDMRIYAAALPFSFYIVSTGTAVFISFLKKKLGYSETESEPWGSAGILQPITTGILLTCLFGSLVLMTVGNLPAFENPPECALDQEEIYFQIGNNSSVILVQDNEIAESYVPNIRISDFRAGVISGPIYTYYPFFDQELLNLSPNQIINIVTYVYPQEVNFGAVQSGYLITTGEVLPSGFHAGCGVPPQYAHAGIPLFYYKNNVENKMKTSFSISNPALIGLIRFFYGLIIFFIVFATVTDRTAFRLMLWRKQILLFGNFILIIFGILVYLHSNALFPISWQRVRLEVESATLIDGYAYQVPLGVNWMNQKSMRQPPVNVYEDGVLLKRPNAKIFAVKNLGRGRFFVQDGYLYISTSDNSDPKVNGKNYEIEWPTPIRTRYQLALYLLSVIGIFVHFKFFTTITKTSG